MQFSFIWWQSATQRLWAGGYFIYFICNYALQPLRLIVPSGLDFPPFATRRLHACHHARASSGGKWNCWREMSGKVCRNAGFHVTFRDLLHPVKLRHGTDGFTSPLKEGACWGFFRPKNPTALAECEPANLSTKGQHATSGPPKPLRQEVRSSGLLLHKLVNQLKKFLLQNSAVPRSLLSGPKLARRPHVALPCSRGSSSRFNFLYVVI
jgi:hypothetical protein